MIQQSNCNWWWRLGLLLSLTVTTNAKALAQVTADQTLGTQVINIRLRSFILDGTTVGNTNLFHSFSSFNVPNGGGAFFLNDPNITNIFARVTGGKTSDIQGLIYAQGTANLFLINPNGIVFGRNAQLNIGGSFVATTANAIQFTGGAEFSLTSPVAPGNTLLSVNPTAFLFNQIANQGANSIENRGYLAVLENKSLILLGGNVAPTTESTGKILVDGGVLEGGRIEIGGLNSPGIVGINTDNDNLHLNFSNAVVKTDASFNESAVGAFGVNGGVTIYANNIDFYNSTLLARLAVSSENPDAKVGDIAINASGTVNLFQGSNISNISLEPVDSGNINIKAQSLTLTNGSVIQALATQGNSGVVNIQVEDTISLSGQDIDGLPNVIQSIVFPQELPTNGRSLGINIQAQNISLSDGAIIGANSSRVGGQAGDIKLQAVDTIILNNFASIITSSTNDIERAGDISIITNQLHLENSSQISSGTLGNGNAGNIDIKASDIILNNSFVTAAASSLPEVISNVGNAGDINVKTERLILTNSGMISSFSSQPEPGETIGRGGNIHVIATDYIEIDGKDTTDTITGFLATTRSFSRAGDITINTRNLNIKNGDILSSSVGQGDAGNIFIVSNEKVFVNGGDISSSTRSQGNAGNIQIQTPQLTVTNESFINTGVIQPTESFLGGQGKAGDIIFDTDYFLLNNDSLVSANTQYIGDGGNIFINTRSFGAFSGAEISTTTASSGKAGNITINAADDITVSGVNANGDRTAIIASTISTGNGGTISLSTTNFNLLDGAGVFASSLKEGIAGNVNITAQGNFNANNGLISARAEQSSGGNINANARNINLRNNSDIRTDLSSGNAKGGNIFLAADTIIALEDSDILAFAPEGQGGNITFNTRALFSDSLYRSTQTLTDRNSFQLLNNNGSSDINASGAISGNIIGVPDISFIQNSLTELQNSPIDTNALIANSCIARSPKQEGTFIITGTGGLPHRPGEAAASSYPTGDVQSVTNNSGTSSWKKGDRIVEPEGVYRLANGDLVMSRECR